MNGRARGSRDRLHAAGDELRAETAVGLAVPSVDLSALHGVTELLRTLGRHWSAVGTLQRRLPLAVQQRLLALDVDADAALEQTLHLFAYEFPPTVVAAMRQRIDAALEAIESLRPGSDAEEALRGRDIDAARFAVIVRDVITAGDLLEVHLQPIVPLSSYDSAAPAGFEALARFQTTPYEAPDIWLDRAAQAGLLQELELSCARSALALVPLLPDGAFLTVNVSAETLVSPAFVRVLDGVPADRIVVEVTEHAIVREYDALLRALGGLRERGVRLAVDDAGAGFASFRHVLELSPEIIKLDIHLTRGISNDLSRQALVRSLVAFAGDVGSTLVAEGIETPEDLQTLRDAHVPYGQGYLFARPGPAERVLGLSA
ncbi:MAG TPA: EAL domain-containing protein [Mycobacteriales bacterium]|jgi:EAL domain-containing protein (putative c-di-GMP-specific phosphodiesterase class I)|nr:EAL domain-containing protein [Mycobacteriales bacterium]